MTPQPATGHPEPSPRTRVTAACQSCRRRKIKCNAQDLQAGQACTACRQAKLHCFLDVNNDGRKVGAKKQIKTLQQRIAVLEGTANRGKEQELDIADDERNRFTESTKSRNLLVQSHLKMTTNVTRSEDLMTRCGTQPETSLSRVEDEAYFGRTSQPHVWSPDQRSFLSSPDTSNTPADEPELPGMEIDMYSATLKDHLLGLYFKYQPLWLSVVEKGRFMKDRARKMPSQWYSSFLEFVLLACAARLSTSSAVRALSHEYAKEARKDIMHALEHPSTASLQGFLMLSEYEVTLGRDRLGWMLCGMACRMIPDIGIHHKMLIPSRSQDDGNAETADADLYFRLLCACISYEGIWCLYLGRPSSIQRTIADAALEQCEKLSAPNAKMAKAWVGLCIPMAEINEVLNGLDLSDPRTHERLTKLDKALCHWQDSLPTSVAYDGSNIGNMDCNAYGLQMQYCKVRILIHENRAFPALLRKRRASQLDDPSQSNAHVSAQSCAIVYEHALRMAKLLFTYCRIFGTEKVPSIMLDNALVSAMSLITLSTSETFLEHSFAYGTGERSRAVAYKEIKVWLKSIVNTLQAVEQHFPITRRMIRSLEQMTLNTPLASVVPSPSPAPITYEARLQDDEGSIPMQIVPRNATSEQIKEAIFPPRCLPPTTHAAFAPQAQSNNMFSSRTLLGLTTEDLQSQWPEDDTAELAASALSWTGTNFMSSMFSPVV